MIKQYTQTGDEMAPTIPSGALVLAREIHPERFIEWGEAFLLETIDGPLLARLIPSDDEAHYRCTRDNSERFPDNSKRYPDLDVLKSDVEGIFRVFAVAQYM